MEISVVHPSLNKAGGAERYLIEMIKCLQDLGHNVSLYSIDKTDWNTLDQTHNLMVDPNREHYLQEKPLTPDGLIQWLKIAIAYTWLLIRGCEESDICINNYGEILPYFSQVSVVHSVPMSSVKDNNYGIPFWSLIKRVYGYVSKRLDPYSSEAIITNSRFNAARIRHTGRVEVINPPVQLPSTINAEKNGEILTVARLKPSKNLNKIAERAHVAGRTE